METRAREEQLKCIIFSTVPSKDVFERPRQPEVVFAFLCSGSCSRLVAFLGGGFAQMFGQIVPIGVKTLRQNPLRHVKMAMTSVPVDVLLAEQDCGRTSANELGTKDRGGSSQKINCGPALVDCLRTCEKWIVFGGEAI